MIQNMKPIWLHQKIRPVLGGMPIVILLTYWAITQLVVYCISGVKTSVDTGLYLQNANELLSTLRIEEAHDVWYVGYSIFLALMLSLSGSLQAVVFFQILISGLALLALYKAVLAISEDKNVAFIAGILYVFWFEIHTWNVFIYTESFFISSSVITFYLLVRSKTYAQYGFAIVVMLFTCLIRPAGFSLLIASASYLFVKLRLSGKQKILVGSTTLCLMIMLLNKMLESYELISSYAKGEIIYPNVSILIDKIPVVVPASHHYPLLALIDFIFNHPIFFFKMCAIKLALFFGHAKPYFSILHNSYIALVLYPLYFFAFWAYRFSRIDTPILVFVISFVWLQAVTVMLTTENWDGRFLLPALPFVFILSAFGIIHFLRTRISVR